MNDSMFPKVILITGGCGFIGTSLISKLKEIYPLTSICVLDNFTTGSPDDVRQVADCVLFTPGMSISGSKIVIFKGDICDPLYALKYTRGVDCIVHLAANTGVGPSVKDPRLDMKSNVIGTFNMLEAARINSVKSFIFASSGAPAGNVEPPIHEELAPHPVSPYGAGKLAGEGYCSAYFYTFGIKTVCLRFGNVYGPRSEKKNSVVAKFIRKSLQNEACEIYGDGTQTRDFLYIDDLVEAVMLCIQKQIGGETLQIATGRERTLKEVAQLIHDSLDRRGIRMRIVHGDIRAGDVKRNFADTRKVQKLIGWSARTDFKEGIDNTIEYFIKLKNQKDND